MSQKNLFNFQHTFPLCIHRNSYALQTEVANDLLCCVVLAILPYIQHTVTMRCFDCFLTSIQKYMTFILLIFISHLSSFCATVQYKISKYYFTLCGFVILLLFLNKLYYHFYFQSSCPISEVSQQAKYFCNYGSEQQHSFIPKNRHLLYSSK